MKTAVPQFSRYKERLLLILAKYLVSYCTLFILILAHFCTTSLKCTKISANIMCNCGVHENKYMQKWQKEIKENIVK